MKLRGKDKEILESIFGKAVALDERGRLKNEVYCGGDTIFIYGHDYSVLFRFRSPVRFDEPFGFPADLYDGGDIELDSGKVSFKKREGEWSRSLQVPAPRFNFGEVESDWERLKNFFVDGGGLLEIGSEVASLLDDRLSHVEFLYSDGKWKVLQRDVYSGELIVLEKASESLFSSDRGEEGFVFGMRSRDLFALFLFEKRLLFSFSKDGKLVKVKGNFCDMEGFVAGCMFDGMGKLEVVMEGKDGRQKQEEQQGEQRPDREDQKRNLIQAKPKIRRLKILHKKG